MKIVVLDGYTENPGDLSWQGLEQLGDVTVYDRTPAELVTQRIGDAEIIYTNKTPITRQVLEASPSVKFVGVLATGYNVVDVQAARELGVTVTNIPTYGTAAVAQYTFALLLEVCHHVGEHNAAVQRGEWQACPDFCFWNYPLIELAGKTLGLIGCGRIGREVAKIAAAFGMKVIAFNPHNTSYEGIEFVQLEDIFARSDVISLHCPLFEENRGIINRASIQKMKDGVIIINTARGPLIVEQDLREALMAGKVAGAAVDVVSSEPIGADNPLLGLKNCIITPHIAWAPKESRMRLMDIAVENLASFLKGEPINVVS